MGVAYERDIQNVWCLGVPRTGLRTTALDHVYNLFKYLNFICKKNVSKYLNLLCLFTYFISGTFLFICLFKNRELEFQIFTLDLSVIYLKIF